MQTTTPPAAGSTCELVLPLYFSDLWRGMKRFRWVFFLFLAVVSILTVILFSVFFPPSYTTTVSAAIQLEYPPGDGQHYGFAYTWATAEQLSPAVDYVLDSAALEQAICRSCGCAEIPVRLQANLVGNTNMLTIRATGTDPQIAYQAVCVLLEQLPQIAEPIIGRSQLVLFSDPTVPTQPDTLPGALGLLYGLLIGTALWGIWLLLYALLRDTIRTRRDVSRYLEQPCLGILPDFRLDSEGYQASLCHLAAALERHCPSVILVTGTVHGEGVTETVQRLAQLYEHQGHHVAVLDGTQPFQNPRQQKSGHSIVLIDAPPCAIYADAGRYAQTADAVVYVIQQDLLSAELIRQSIDALAVPPRAEFGCVINRAAVGFGSYGQGKPSRSAPRPDCSDAPIRVLQIVGRMDRGGIETMVMNLYRAMDRTKVQFDFLAHYGREAAYNDEIRAMGGRIYEMPALKCETKVYYWKLFSYLRALRCFFKEHSEFRILHGHMTNTASLYMPIARRFGVTCRIAHSHSTKSKAGLQGLVTDLLQKPVYRFATDCFACSDASRFWLFPPSFCENSQVHLLPNAIDLARFQFSSELRSAVRQELSLGDEKVIICVARFRSEKNQQFLLDVLRELLQRNEPIALLFVGDGPCRQAFLDRAASMGLTDQIRVLGQRSDVDRLLQAADAFVLPSLWEGLPVSGVEALANGLHGVVSDQVSEELNLTGMVTRLSLQAPVQAWADALLQAANAPREDTQEQLRRAGYDITATAAWLQAFYLRKQEEAQR